MGKLYLNILSERLKHLGIEKQFSVLVLLDKRGDKCCQQFISDTLHIDKTMMVGVIDDLRKKGFITRTQNPADKREYWIRLTPKAKKHMPEIKEAVQDINKSILKGISPAVIADLNTCLNSIYKNLKEKSTH